MFLAFFIILGALVGGSSDASALLFGLLGVITQGIYMAIRDRIAGPQPDHKNPEDNFITYLLIFASAVMKADGKVMRSELDSLVSILNRHFRRPERVSAAIEEFRIIINKNYDILDKSVKFKYGTQMEARVLMMQLLCEIAAADGVVSYAERMQLDAFYRAFELSPDVYESIKAMYFPEYQQDTETEAGYSETYSGSGSQSYGGYSGRSSSSGSRGRQDYHGSSVSQNLAHDYKILGVSPTVSDIDLKKAYRNLAKEFHPDKVSYLGDEMRQAAEEKFARLNQAYDRIKQSRGMK